MRVPLIVRKLEELRFFSETDQNHRYCGRLILATRYLIAAT